MRTVLRGKATLLFVTFAVLLAAGGTALALTTDLSGITDPLSGITDPLSGTTDPSGTSGTASPTVVSSQADFTPDASGTTATSGATTSPSPTIASDRVDYAPAELVTLTGGGWQQGEPVNIKVNDTYGASWSRNVEVTADASGRITDSFDLPNWFVSDYDVAATGVQSGTATTTFTDGNASSVTGAVIDSVTHQPISGATVTCAPSGGCNGTVTTTTNASGVYFFDSGTGSPKLTFQGNDPTALTLTVSKPGYASGTIDLGSVGNGATLTGKDVALIDSCTNPAAPVFQNTPSASGWYNNASTGIPTPNATTSTAGATLKYSLSESGTYTATAPSLGQGQTTVYAKASDSTGNCSTAAVSRLFKVDSNAPAISPGDVVNNTWSNTPLGPLSFRASDTGSGLANASDATFTLTASAESTKDASGNEVPTTVSKTVSDVAGNTTTRKVLASIDLHAPTITASVDPRPDGNGWNNSNVTVHFTCTDALSGVPAGACPADAVLGEGANQSVTKSVTDAAGNTASVTKGGINIDKTAPTITASVDPTANASGWNKTDVKVHFTCADNGGSGLASDACPADVTVSSEGANQSVTKSVTDQAGNTTSATEGGINIDKTAPIIMADRTPEPNGDGWNSTDVEVSYTCNDTLSGMDSGGCPTDDTVSSEGAGQSRSGTATDKAGNSATATVSGIDIDKTAPTVAYKSASPLPNANGWNNSDVTATFEATDSFSGMGATDADKTATGTAATSGEGANVTVDSPAFTDRAGNTARAGAAKSDPFKIDQTDPTIQGSRSPAANADGWNNTDVEVHFTCSDASSGVDPSGCPADVTLGEGENQSVTRSVTDEAGNTASATEGNIDVDKTPPTISASVLNDPAPSGWYNTSTGGPRVRFECSDALSGVETGSCPADHTVTDEGASVPPYPGSVSDRAGNSASASAGPFMIDLTAPDVAGAPDLTTDSGDPNDNLTNVKAPTFDVTAEAGSTVKLFAKKDGVEEFIGQGTATDGTATITSNQQLADGTYDVYAHVVDQAGNASDTNAVTVTVVTIDATGPDAPGLDMAASSDTGVSDSDDKTKNDTPTFGGGAEAGSTLELYDGASPLTTIRVGPGGTWSFTPTSALSEGNHTIKATAIDAAGNASNEGQLSVVIDKTPPTISASVLNDPAPSGWYNTSTGGPRVRFECSDALSGVETGSCPADHTVTDEGPSVTYPGTANDVAGNSASASAGPFMIDLTAPDVAGAPDLLATSDTGTSSTDNLTGVRAPTFDVTAEAGSTVELFAQKVVGGNPSGTETSIGQGTATDGTATITSNQQLADGDYKVHARVTDQAGNESDTSVLNITIVAIDATAPQLTLPANITGVEATSAAGATVNYAAGANDAVDGAGQVDCSKNSGDTFALGTTTVNCSATDRAGNTAGGSFDVTVRDTAAPVIAPHADVTAEAPGPGGATVTYAFPATGDAVDGAKTASCAPASGGQFPLGEATVTCTARDAAGNPATPTTFKVKVQDTTNPTLDTHLDVNATATSSAGAVVNYATPAAHDAVTANPTVACTPAPGATFPVGSTTVGCTAGDAARNVSAPTTFEVDFSYGWSGFLQPINTPANMGTGYQQSVFKIGSTVPVKFQLAGASAGVTDGNFYLKYIRTGNGDGLGEPEVVATATGNTGTQFRYDATAGQYIFNWSTKTITANQAGNYEVRVYTDPGFTNLLGSQSIELRK